MVLLIPLESSSSFIFQWKYDVFLSFRGSDTRRNFTDHLYAALHKKGVHAFKDDKQLERGKNISTDLLQAIRESRFSIVIFSKNYADSIWCLEELEIIFDCMEKGTLTVIPVFYGVDPSDVQNLTGEYGKAFAKHTTDHPDKVPKWRVAIKEIANVSGWDLQNRHEAKFIQDIVDGLLDQLRNVGSKFSKEEEGLVGVDKHLMQLELCLRERLNDVSIIGIYGMGGIGKTTIARVLYNRMFNQFEWRAFLSNVREMEGKHGLTRLQEQLLSKIVHENNLRIWDIHQGIDEIRSRLQHKKALVVLDDVDKLEQLKSLAAKSDWFGAGSIIIITTKDKHLLRHYESCRLHNVIELDNEEALQLFCLKAFKRQRPKEGFGDLSRGFVKYCKGLPLAIDVIGNFLKGMSIDEWDSALRRLKKIPNKCILDKLQISFDGLEETEQQIFLDIACFFKGEDQDHVKRILESCDFYPDIGIRVLIDKSLISIGSHNRIVMHDLLQDMGREIVRRQSPVEPQKRSRLWLCEDVYHVLSNNTGTENIETIIIEESYKEGEEWSNVEVRSTEVFLKMKRLRLLQLQSLNISCELAGLPNTLRYLNWKNCPFKYLPDAFNANQLVELHMQNSKLKQLWKGIKVLKQLMVVDLSHSEELILIPDFTGMPNLKILNLEGCIKLFKIHESIGLLKKLESLNLRDCKSLRVLPSSICNVKSLKSMKLSWCSSLEGLQKRIGELTCLETLDIRGVGKREVSLAKPWELFLPWKKQGTCLSPTLPSSLSHLRSLKELYLRDCHLKLIPFDFGCFPLLHTLDLSGNDFVSPPSGLSQLSNLKLICLQHCKNLEALPEWPSKTLQLFEGSTSLKTFAIPDDHEKGRPNSQVRLTRRFSWYKAGVEIPKWFTHQTFDDELTVSLSPNWCNDKCMGFAACSVLGTDHIRVYTCGFTVEDCEVVLGWLDPKDYAPKNSYLWVAYTPLYFFKKSVGWWNEGRKITFSCLTIKRGAKSLGFRIIYEQDLGELSRHFPPFEKYFTPIGPPKANYGT